LDGRLGDPYSISGGCVEMKRSILIDRSRHSSIPHVRSFRAADCDTDDYLVEAKLREMLVVSKQTRHRIHMERFNSRNVMKYGKLSVSLVTAQCSK
jgi:hypothetical protein